MPHRPHPAAALAPSAGPHRRAGSPRRAAARRAGLSLLLAAGAAGTVAATGCRSVPYRALAETRVKVDRAAAATRDTLFRRGNTDCAAGTVDGKCAAADAAVDPFVEAELAAAAAERTEAPVAAKKKSVAEPGGAAFADDFAAKLAALRAEAPEPVDPGRAAAERVRLAAVDGGTPPGAVTAADAAGAADPFGLSDEDLFAPAADDAFAGPAVDPLAAAPAGPGDPFRDVAAAAPAAPASPLFDADVVPPPWDPAVVSVPPAFEPPAVDPFAAPAAAVYANGAPSVGSAETVADAPPPADSPWATEPAEITFGRPPLPPAPHELAALAAPEPPRAAAPETNDAPDDDFLAALLAPAAETGQVEEPAPEPSLPAPPVPTVAAVEPVAPAAEVIEPAPAAVPADRLPPVRVPRPVGVAAVELHGPVLPPEIEPVTASPAAPLTAGLGLGAVLLVGLGAWRRRSGLG